MDDADFFRVGQAVYRFAVGATRAHPMILTLGVVRSITHAPPGSSWRTLKSRGRLTFCGPDGRGVAVFASSLAHAGWCPLCELPAHARLLRDGTLLPHCARCQFAALPTPPPEAWTLARLGRRESDWMRYLQSLAIEGRFELTWDQDRHAYTAFAAKERLAESVA